MSKGVKRFSVPATGTNFFTTNDCPGRRWLPHNSTMASDGMSSMEFVLSFVPHHDVVADVEIDYDTEGMDESSCLSHLQCVVPLKKDLSGWMDRFGACKEQWPYVVNLMTTEWERMAALEREEQLRTETILSSQPCYLEPPKPAFAKPIDVCLAIVERYPHSGKTILATCSRFCSVEEQSYDSNMEHGICCYGVYMFRSSILQVDSTHHCSMENVAAVRIDPPLVFAHFLHTGLFSSRGFGRSHFGTVSDLFSTTSRRVELVVPEWIVEARLAFADGRHGGIATTPFAEPSVWAGRNHGSGSGQDHARVWRRGDTPSGCRASRSSVHGGVVERHESGSVCDSGIHPADGGKLVSVGSGMDQGAVDHEQSLHQDVQTSGGP